MDVANAARVSTHMLSAHQNAARGLMTTLPPVSCGSPIESGVISHLLLMIIRRCRRGQKGASRRCFERYYQVRGRGQHHWPGSGGAGAVTALRAAPGLSGGLGASRGTDVLLEPAAERPGGPQEAGHPVTGGRGLQPGLDRPLLPGDDPLVAEQADPRVVGGIAARRALQDVTPGDADSLVPGGGDGILELAAGPVAGPPPPVPVELVGRHAVHAVAGRQALEGELDVPAADQRADVRLVGRLVFAEPDVAVWPEDLRLAELRCQLLH